MSSDHLFIIGAQIGFTSVSTSIEEGSIVTVDIVVLNGSLGVAVSVRFNTVDTGNATSQCIV